MSNPNDVLPSGAANFYYPTILLALEVSELAYEVYGVSSLLKTDPKQPSEKTLLDAGWTPILGTGAEEVVRDNYQGIAFYKMIGGVTEVVIGNRGSQPRNLHRYLSLRSRRISRE